MGGTAGGDLLDSGEEGGEDFLAGGKDFLSGISGQSGAEAATKAAKIQAQSAERALQLLRGDLAPFRNILSPDQIGNITALSTDPTAQADFLGSNPLFQGLADESQRRIFSNQAAQGKLGSGGTQEALQSSLLNMGNQLIDQQLNRQLPLLNIGQASAAQAAAGSSDLITGAGAAQSAGQIGAANAQAQGAQNMTTVGLMAMLSDERLKQDIEFLSTHNGVNVYKWKWNQEAKNLGVTGFGKGHMAQELEKSHPHLVVEIDGIKRVNYSTNETVEPKLWH